MELAALQSIMCIAVPDVLGCLAPPGAHCFQRLDGFPATPAPDLRMRTGSSSPERNLSFRVRSCLSPAHRSRAPGASLKVSFPIATSECEVHLPPGIPSPTRFRPQRFSRSRRVPPSHTFAGLFHPTATSGIRSSGGFLAAKPAHLIGGSCPRVVAELRLPTGCPFGASSARSASRALIRAAIRCS
jgi:hypothetical protein